eukprot:518014_1
MGQHLPSEEKQESRCNRGACISIFLLCVGAGAFFFFLHDGHGPNSHAPPPVALSTQKIPLVTANGPKWAKVKNALTTPINDYHSWMEVREAVAPIVVQFNTPSLNTFLKMSERQEQVFYGDVTVYQVLDFIRQRALGVKMKSLPILPSGTTAKVTLTQGQVLDLNAFGFFGLLKRPFDAKSQDPNISLLFRAVKAGHGYPADKQLRQEKIRCIMHYFARMMITTPTSLTKHHITVFRNSVPKGGFQNLRNQGAGNPLVDVEFMSGRMEEYPSQGAIEIDFANKTFGGGFLGSGAAQEENRLIIAPGTFLGAMIAETMDTNESITVVGAEIVSSYIGYGHHGVAGKTGFTWNGDFQDHTPVGPDGHHRLTAIVAIDVKKFHPNIIDQRQQFLLVNIQRSFLKQFAGFSVPDSFPLLKDRQTVVTGLLGCGVFGNLVELQFVKQWAILSLTGAKKMVFYYSPRNQDLEDFAKWAQENRMTAGKLLKALEHLQFANRVKITETGGQCKSNAVEVLKDAWRVWRRFIAGEP